MTLFGRMIGIALAFQLGIAGGASAQQAQSSTPPDLLVTNAERLFVRVYGFPELAGEYRINADETVSIPVLGRVSVHGVTAAELEKDLSKRATELAHRDVSVTVESVAYKPVYVTGFVDKPGAVAWTPGLTVLQAVALGGGPRRSSSVGSNDAGSSQGDVTKTLHDMKQLVATLARLRAERRGETTIQVPDELVQLAGADEAKQIIATHTELLKSRLAARQVRADGVERARAVAEQELQGLDAESKRIAEQLKLRRDSSRKIGDLQAKGLVSVGRSLEEQLRVSELEEKSGGVAVATARIHATIAGLERDGDKTVEDNAALDVEILKTEQDLSLLRSRLQNERPSEFRVSENGIQRTKVFTYQIIRNRGSNRRITSAQETDALLPADVLVVGQE